MIIHSKSGGQIHYATTVIDIKLAATSYIKGCYLITNDSLSSADIYGAKSTNPVEYRHTKDWKVVYARSGASAPPIGPYPPRKILKTHMKKNEALTEALSSKCLVCAQSGHCEEDRYVLMDRLPPQTYKRIFMVIGVMSEYKN